MRMKAAQVALYMRAWIEVIYEASPTVSFIVALYMRAWIDVV